MRKIKIHKAESILSIEKFENKLVASLALQFAETENDLEELYNFGMEKFEEYKNNLSEIDFTSFSAWNIKQDIAKFQRTKLS